MRLRSCWGPEGCLEDFSGRGRALGFQPETQAPALGWDSQPISWVFSFSSSPGVPPTPEGQCARSSSCRRGTRESSCREGRLPFWPRPLVCTAPGPGMWLLEKRAWPGRREGRRSLNSGTGSLPQRPPRERESVGCPSPVNSGATGGNIKE